MSPCGMSAYSSSLTNCFCRISNTSIEEHIDEDDVGSNDSLEARRLGAEGRGFSGMMVMASL